MAINDEIYDYSKPDQTHSCNWVKNIIIRKPYQPLQGSVGYLKFEVVIKVVMNLREESWLSQIIR